MKLNNTNEPVVGGYWFQCEDGHVVSLDHFKGLESMVRSYLTANNLFVPEDLNHIIQDQICQRQPPGKCRYTKGLGDQLSRAIHAGGALVDKALGTKIEKKARGCSRCGQRRMAVNSLTRNA